MLLLKNINNYNNNYIFFSEPVKNKIIDDSLFIRIIYSTHTVSFNGIYFIIPLKNITT